MLIPQAFQFHVNFFPVIRSFVLACLCAPCLCVFTFRSKITSFCENYCRLKLSWKCFSEHHRRCGSACLISSFLQIFSLKTINPNKMHQHKNQMETHQNRTHMLHGWNTIRVHTRLPILARCMRFQQKLKSQHWGALSLSLQLFLCSSTSVR